MSGSAEFVRLRGDSLRWRFNDDGEVMVRDPSRSLFFTVNRSGATLWEALVSGAPRSTLVRQLADRYRLDDQQAEQDVDSFLAMLDQRELLDRAAR